MPYIHQSTQRCRKSFRVKAESFPLYGEVFTEYREASICLICFNLWKSLLNVDLHGERSLDSPLANETISKEYEKFNSVENKKIDWSDSYFAFGD